MAIGDWSDNKMHGEGFYTYANGDMYTGSFQHGIKHGKGSYYFKVMSSTSCLATLQCLSSAEGQLFCTWNHTRMHLLLILM